MALQGIQARLHHHPMVCLAEDAALSSRPRLLLVPWHVQRHQRVLEPEDRLTKFRQDHALTALYATFSVVGFFAGTFANKLGVRLTLSFGGLGYGLYVAALLCYNHTQKSGFLVFSGALLGVCAGLLWMAQGAIMMSYPLESSKGRFISWFWMTFNLGGVLGLMFCGAILALSLCDAGKVVLPHGRQLSTGQSMSNILFVLSIRLLTHRTQGHGCSFQLWPQDGQLRRLLQGHPVAGAAIFWAIDSRSETTYMAEFASSWGLLAGALVIASPVIFLKIEDHVTVEEDLRFSDETLADVLPAGHAEKQIEA